MDMDLARGLVASYAAEIVRDRSRLPLIFASALGVVLLLAALALRGGLGIFLVVLALLVLGFSAVVALLRWVALFSIRRLAAPVPGFRDRVAEAIEQADLPTGPLSIVRLLNRLRKGGVDDEVDRLQQVLADLADELDGQ